MRQVVDLGCAASHVQARGDLMNPPDTGNKFGVCINGKHALFLMTSPKTEAISPDDALNLAAWLVVLAEDHASHSFVEVLAAIENA